MSEFSTIGKLLKKRSLVCTVWILIIADRGVMAHVPQVVWLVSLTLPLSVNVMQTLPVLQLFHPCKDFD